MEETLQESFDSMRDQLQVIYQKLPSGERDKVTNVIKDLGHQFVWGLSEEDFKLLLQDGTPDSLFRTMGHLVASYVPQFSSTQLQGLPQPLVELALRVSLARWIHEDGQGATGWSIPSSIVIKGAVSERLRGIRETERQQQYYDSLGQRGIPPSPSDPLTVSPTQSLESRADLSPEAKVNVLRNYMDAHNRAGITGADGVYRTGHLKYHGRSLEAARRFFAVNPKVAVEHLTGIISDCCDVIEHTPLPDIYREEDPHKILRECRNLSYLLTMLRQIHRETPEFELPAERFLTKKELFGPHFDPDAPPGADHPDRPPLLTG